MFFIGAFMRRSDPNKEKWNSLKALMALLFSTGLIFYIGKEDMLLSLVSYFLASALSLTATVVGYLSPPKWFERILPRL